MNRAEWQETPDAPLHSLPSLSLRNKNKAKNFRSFIGKPLPPKIIFTDEVAKGTPTQPPSETLRLPSVDSQSVVSTLILATAEPQPAGRIFPFLIPPSSRPSLPPNLFVTSVDVEGDLQRPKKKKKTQAAVRCSAEAADYSYYGSTRAGKETGRESMGFETSVVLDYGNDGYDTHVQTEHPTQQHSRGKGDTPFSDIDIGNLEQSTNANWTTLRTITRDAQLNAGDIVAYKCLGINPMTFTPENLLTLAQVISLDPLMGGKIVVRPLRPRTEASFSGRLDENVQGEEIQDEEFELEDVVERDWRFVQEH